jgi:tetratricopeptide (TPR) repeat protein
MAHDRFCGFSVRSCWLALVMFAVTLCSWNVAEAQPKKSVVGEKLQNEVVEEGYRTLLSLLDRYRATDADVLPEIGRYWYRLYTTDRETIPSLMQRVPVEIAPLAEMALTEVAILAFEREQTKLANAHLSTAERFIDVKVKSLLHWDDAARERQIRFELDWYKAIIWLRCARGELLEGRAIMDRALGKFPHDPDVLLSAGTYEELGFTRIPIEKSRDRPTPGSREKFVETAARRQRAIGFFREAIQLDPNAAEARIRLAFLLAMLGDSRREDAVTLLKEARAIETKPPLGYLAALFAGNVEEERKQLETASTWYRTAIADCPLAQTARLALSHLQLDQYDNIRPAQNTLRPLTGSPPSTAREGCEPDPWRLYDFGQAWRLHEHLEHMRRMVRETPQASAP